MCWGPVLHIYIIKRWGTQHFPGSQQDSMISFVSGFLRFPSNTIIILRDMILEPRLLRGVLMTACLTVVIITLIADRVLMEALPATRCVLVTSHLNTDFTPQCQLASRTSTEEKQRYDSSISRLEEALPWVPPSLLRCFSHRSLRIERAFQQRTSHETSHRDVGG